MKKLKQLIYSFVDLFYPRGIRRIMNGTVIFFPSKWSRYFRDGYEKQNFDFATQHLSRGATAIDIGAHIGLFAVHLAKVVGADGKVYAFEPSPYTFKVLNKVVSLNKSYGNISPVPFAVSDKKGEVIFNIAPDSAGVSNTLAAIANTVPVNVGMISIDEFKTERNLRIDFMKIDAEGAEYFVLKGAKKTFLVDRPYALMGLHPWQIKSMGTSLEKIWSLLEDYMLEIRLDGAPVEKTWFCSQTELFDVELIPRKIA